MLFRLVQIKVTFTQNAFQKHTVPVNCLFSVIRALKVILLAGHYTPSIISIAKLVVLMLFAVTCDRDELCSCLRNGIHPSCLCKNHITNNCRNEELVCLDDDPLVTSSKPVPTAIQPPEGGKKLIIIIYIELYQDSNRTM